MKVHSIIADLRVPDIEGSREFYADYLGLGVEEFNLGWVARFTSAETGAHLQVVTKDATPPSMRSSPSRSTMSTPPTPRRSSAGSRSSIRSPTRSGECAASSSVPPTATSSTSSPIGSRR